MIPSAYPLGTEYRVDQRTPDPISLDLHMEPASKTALPSPPFLCPESRQVTVSTCFLLIGENDYRISILIELLERPFALENRTVETVQHTS